VARNAGISVCIMIVTVTDSDQTRIDNKINAYTGCGKSSPLKIFAVLSNRIEFKGKFYIQITDVY